MVGFILGTDVKIKLFHVPFQNLEQVIEGGTHKLLEKKIQVL